MGDPQLSASSICGRLTEAAKTQGEVLKHLSDFEQMLTSRDAALQRFAPDEALMLGMILGTASRAKSQLDAINKTCAEVVAAHSAWHEDDDVRWQWLKSTIADACAEYGARHAERGAADVRILNYFLRLCTDVLYQAGVSQAQAQEHILACFNQQWAAMAEGVRDKVT